ncbi:MAG: iron ABC transporter permease [Desulfobulbaceae bacterium]|nr:iron ABC transporter permease [Desulfobulbaceae bacterium]
MNQSPQVQPSIPYGQKRPLALFVILFLLMISMVAVNICTGSVTISLSELFHLILRPDTTTESFILWKIRFPRALAAVLCGGYLAVSGLLLQVYFRNPVVGPFILGISSGATLMVSLVMLTSLTMQLHIITPFTVTLAAMAGACIVMTIVVAIASRVKNGITLLIIGLMMGYLCSAVTSVLTALAEEEQVKGFILWQLGSFSGFKWDEISLLLLVGGLLLMIVFLLAKPLNGFLLGEEYAMSMGINIRIFRMLILFLACSLAGMITAMAGPVAFIGLAIPHMARMIFSTSDNRILIPGTFFLGALVASGCDFIARSLLSPVELPLSAITAFFGAPVVICLLMKKRVQL